MKGLTTEHLKEVRRDMHELAPGYYLPQTDALEALKTKVGNCFAKAMITCGIVAIRYSIEPSVVYSDRLHGTHRRSRKPIDPRTNKNMAHIAMVVPGQEGDHIPALHFGVNVTKGVKMMKEDEVGEIENDYNTDAETFLQTRPDGIIVPTEYGADLGLVSGEWEQLGQQYLSRIDRPALDVRRLLEELGKKGIHGQTAA